MGYRSLANAPLTGGVFVYAPGSRAYARAYTAGWGARLIIS